MSVVHHHKYPTSAKIKVIHASKIFPISYLQCAVISVAILGPDLFLKKIPQSTENTDTADCVDSGRKLISSSFVIKTTTSKFSAKPVHHIFTDTDRKTFENMNLIGTRKYCKTRIVRVPFISRK